MRAAWGFPAVVRAFVPNAKGERLCAIKVDGEFEVAEVEIGSMPLAFTTALDGSDSAEVRILDGKLYQIHCDLETFDDCDRQGDDLLAYGNNRAYADLAEEIIAVARRSGQSFWPKGLWNRRHKGLETAEKSGLALASAAGSDIAAWRARFAHSLSRFVISGEDVWVRCGEPVYVVALDTGEVRASTTTLFDKHAMAAPDQIRGMAASAMSTRVFAFDEIDEAVACAVAAGADPRADHSNPITRHAFDLAPSDIRRLEFDRMARIACMRVSERLSRNVVGTETPLLALAPGTLIRSWTDLRGALAGYRPTSGVPDDIEAACIALLDEARLFAEEGNPDVLEGIPVAWMASIVDAWHSRTISLDLRTAPHLR
jgi:hypothetical protein